MSKFRCTVRPGRWRALNSLLPAVALLLAINSVGDSFWSYLHHDAFVLTLAGILSTILLIVLKTKPWRDNDEILFHVLFDDQGMWYQALDPQQLTAQPPWHLTERSRVAPWGVFLAFIGADGQHHCQWILKGELPENEYRRLVRAIRAKQQQ